MKRLMLIALFGLLSQGFATGWQSSQPQMLGGWRHHNGPFQTGNENNGQPLFLCRAYVHGAWTPGKTWSGYQHCNVPYGGQEITADQYQMYYGQPRGYWGEFDGQLPYRAFSVGRDTNGNTLYLCQGKYNGGMQPGKTWANYNHCNISYAGREVLLNQYAVFALGRPHEHHRRHHHHHHDNGRQCVQTPFGKQVCGYHCVATLTHAACGQSPDQHCIADAFDGIKCGHDCHVDDFGQAHCS